MNEITNSPIVESVAKINNGMQAFHDAKQKFIDLAEKAKLITKPDITDKKGIAALKRMRIDLRDEQIVYEKQGKAMRDLITPINKAILKLEDEVISPVTPFIETFKQWEKEIDSELERIEKERLVAEAKRIVERSQRLLGMNMEFAGDRYVYGEISISATDVTAIDDPLFEEFCSRVKALYEADQAAKAEQGRIQALTSERQDAIRPVWHLYENTDPDSHEDTKESMWEKLGCFPEEYFNVLLGNLQKKQADIEAQQERNRKEAKELAEEKKKLRQQRDDMRIKLIFSVLPTAHIEDGEALYFLPDNTTINLLDLADAEFEKHFIAIKSEAEEEKRQQELFDQRSMQLIEAGFLREHEGFRFTHKTDEYGFELVSDENLKLHTDEVWNEWFVGFQDRKAKDAELKAKRDAEEKQRIADEAAKAERERIEKEQKEADEAKRKAEEAARRKAERAPDKTKILVYLKAVQAIPVPELKSSEMTELLQGCREEINQVVKAFEQKINEL